MLTATSVGEMVFRNWTDADGNVVSNEPTFVYALSRGNVTLQANFRDSAAVPLNDYAVIMTSA